MGFFDKLKKAVSAGGAPAKPEAVEAQGGADAICAPVAGEVVELAQVGDPVFSSGALGAGCAIKPEGDVVYSPVAGTVSALIEKSRHAVGISGANGAEVLVHVGIETVEMGGAGFEYLVEEGQRVSAGEPLMRFSREEIARAGKDDTVMLLVTNSDELGSVSLAAAGCVDAGAKALEIAR